MHLASSRPPSTLSLHLIPLSISARLSIAFCCENLRDHLVHIVLICCGVLVFACFSCASCFFVQVSNNRVNIRRNIGWTTTSSSPGMHFESHSPVPCCCLLEGAVLAACLPCCLCLAACLLCCLPALLPVCLRSGRVLLCLPLFPGDLSGEENGTVVVCPTEVGTSRVAISDPMAEQITWVSM